MDQEPENQWEDEDRLREPVSGPVPNRLTWPVKRFFWFLEKRVLWPISDSFRRTGNPGPRHSPMAYVGVTLLVAIAGGAIAAAVYFHDQANDSGSAPAVAQAPAGPGAAIAPTGGTGPAGSDQAGPNSSSTTSPAADGETLQGVVPDFEPSAGESGSGGSARSNNSGGENAGNSGPGKKKKTKGLVNPAPPPKTPLLKAAYRFAQTFTGYEIGKRGAAKKFKASATPGLARELRRNPPTLPADGDVPRATVMNVVKGQKEGRRRLVSVSLLRSGAASELRLALRQAKHKQAKGQKKPWRVSEVRG